MAGGGTDDSVGFFVAADPAPGGGSRLPPHVRGDLRAGAHRPTSIPTAQWAETLTLVDQTSPYALTGAVFARDRRRWRRPDRALRNAAGNFYINDKPTGAVVGQQPFGGARASGTNDKAGSVLNLLRWVSPRSIKETLEPAEGLSLPFMQLE